MFSRFSLFYILVILCLINSSRALEAKQNDDHFLPLQLKDYDIKILQQNVKFAKMEKYISDQDRKIEHQNVRFAEQDRQMAEQNVKICELKSQIEIMKKSETTLTSTQSPIFSNDTGVLFTRWGRSDCPRSISTQVYNGTTGGGHYTHQGASVNYVCMPHEPLYNENKHFGGKYWSLLYGGEYDAEPQSSFNMYEVPCAVCRAAPYSTKLTIPGRNKCYPGWQEVYRGELRSGYYDHKAASEYVCLDGHAQHIGKQNNDNGKLFYPVRAVCGSLPCPPYEQNTLLTCVVCVK